MAYYVYIIKSQVDRTFYKGSTSDYLLRFAEHNAGLGRYTRHKTPWDLVYVEEFQTKSEALIRERKLKRCNVAYLTWLLEQPVNLLKK